MTTPYVLHGLLEGTSALLASVISVTAWQHWTQVRSSFNACWAVGFLLVALGDMTHAVVGMATPDPEVWVPWTATATRIVLLAFLSLGAVWSVNRRVPHHALPWLVGAGGFALLLAMLPWVFTFSLAVPWPVGRPVDVLLAVWFLALWYLYSRHHADALSAQLPTGFALFLALGFVTHVVMSMSHEILDTPFLASHVLRVTEYSVWVFSVVLVGGLDISRAGSLYELARSKAKGEEAAHYLERMKS